MKSCSHHTKKMQVEFKGNSHKFTPQLRHNSVSKNALVHSTHLFGTQRGALILRPPAYNVCFKLLVGRFSKMATRGRKQIVCVP
jgi:hypothetical protein